MRSVGERVLARLARIGADPQDDEDTRASKALLVLISVLILPVSLLWAALYLAFGSFRWVMLPPIAPQPTRLSQALARARVVSLAA